MANYKWLFWYFAKALELPYAAVLPLFMHSKAVEWTEPWHLTEKSRKHGWPRFEICRKGKRHCHFGPAVEYNDGTKKWYRKGKLHRVSGPAVELGDGTKKWYHKGRLHRADGPAVELCNGTKK